MVEIYVSVWRSTWQYMFTCGTYLVIGLGLGVLIGYIIRQARTKSS